MTQAAEAPIGIITYSNAIEEYIAGLKAELARCREAYNELSERYNELSQKETFRDRLFTVKADTLTISHKASIDATVRYLQDHERDRDERGYIKMDAWEVASLAGQSYGTLLNNWSALSRELRIHDGEEIETDVGRVPIFDRLVVRVPTTDRERYPQGYYLETYIKEREILAHPDQYKAGTPVEWGGKRKNAGRKKCQKCDAWMKVKDHIRTMQREHICPNCHTSVWDEVRPVSDEVPPTPNDNKPVNKPIERPEASKNQVDFCSPDGLDDVEIEASKPPLDEVYPALLLHQVASASIEAFTHAPPPEALRVLPIWCCHRDKEPFNVSKPARSYPNAKSDDQTTWTIYDQALAVLKQSWNEGWKDPFDGLMYANNGDFVFIDGDHCRNKDTGEVNELGQEIIAIDSWTEESYGGEGVHSVAYASVSRGRKDTKNGLEMYPDRRFFTYTGKHIAGTPTTIEHRQAEVSVLYNKYFPAQEPTPIVATSRQFTCSRSDAELLDKARNAKNGAKFTKLFDRGDASDYPKADGSPDHSAADEALCELLLYWGDGDVSTLERLFPQSGLMREKWNRADYRERTIKAALALYQRKQVAS